MAATDGGMCWQVTSPSDLTGIGIAIAECLGALSRRGAAQTHVLFDSLSTQFIAIDDRKIWQFAHQLTFQRGFPSGLGVYPVYTNTTAERDLERMKHLADGLIEVRKRGGARQVRCRGFEGSANGWTTLDAPGREPVTSLSD
jgi:hypothetical protein